MSYLRFRWDFEQRTERIPPETTLLALQLAGAISQVVRNGLFETDQAEPVVFQRCAKASGKVTLQCVYPAHDAAHQRRIMSSWQAPYESLEAVADPWLFADDCLEAVCPLLDGVGYNERADRFTTGQRFIARSELASYIATSVKRIPRIPGDQAGVVQAMATVANTVAWGVSGSPELPSINFNAEVPLRPEVDRRIVQPWICLGSRAVL